MKYTKRGFLKEKQKASFCVFSAMENGGGFRRFSCVRGENSRKSKEVLRQKSKLLLEGILV
mgnify:CR=1 FL=1